MHSYHSETSAVPVVSSWGGRVKTLPFLEAVNSLSLPGLNRNLFSSPQWTEVLNKTYGLKVFVKYIKDGGKVRSYIIYSAVKNFLEWKICVLSYSDYCDCPVEDPEDWKLYFASLREEYPQYRIAIRNLRDSTVAQSGCFEELSREKFHILDIRDNIDKVWRRTNDSFRAAVRQGEKKGVTIRVCEKRELKEFYRMHLSLRVNKYKVFPQPYRFFDIIWDQYMAKNQGVLLGAYNPEGNMIAANIYLQCGDTMYYKFNTSSLDALKLRPNNYLFWEGVKLAKERGLSFIDLGSSGADQKGLILYKNHTGAEMRDIVHYGFAPEGYKFSQKRILKVFTKIFTRPSMPPWIVHVGSRIIYPFLA